MCVCGGGVCGWGVSYLCEFKVNCIFLSLIEMILCSVVHLEEIGTHYFETLRYWRQNFLGNQG